jgi:signal transduction histidine kinase
MMNLIDSLLEYSQAAKGTSKVEELDLAASIRQVLDDLELEIQRRGARITFDGLPAIKANRRQMHQLFQNLIGNALKYSRPGVPPEISIASKVLPGKEVLRDLSPDMREKNFYHITVSDNGIGFDQKYAESIFNVFTRLHSDVEYRGSGIGLSIVKKVIESHNGIIWAESSPEKGSAFKILLPV